MIFLKENWLTILIVLVSILFVSWAVKYIIKIFTGPGQPDIETINEDERNKKDEIDSESDSEKDKLDEKHKKIVDKIDKGEVKPSEIFDKEINQ